MALLLCRQTASRPFYLSKLNINIWSEQELCYCIYNNPLLCMQSLPDEGLFSWISEELKMKKLADRLMMMTRAGEGAEAMLSEIVQECNYLDTQEKAAFIKRLSEFRDLSGYDMACMEGRALFDSGNYNAAFDCFSEAVRLLESDYRHSSKKDDAELKNHNEIKADLYCDMAAVKMQMFDEESAEKLLELSKETFYNDRALRMRYLIDKKGDLPEEELNRLDELVMKAKENARETKAYRDVEAIFELDTDSMLKEAARTAAAWKKSFRKM